jgi:hypothetical protein
MAPHTRRGTVLTRWTLLLTAALAAALSVVAVPAAIPAIGIGSVASGPGVASAGPIRPPGTSQVLLGEPRYTIEVLHFRALDESGADWNGSDEVFGLFHSTRGYSTRTSKHGDVDSGDFRRIASGERCLAPQRILSGGTTEGWLVAPDGTRWECDSRGTPGPIGLRLELWEDDGCNPFFPSCFNTYVPPVRDPNDDLIGRVEVTYTASQLASRLPNVGDRFGDTFTLGGPCGHQAPNHVCGVGPLTATGPEYELLVSVHRVSDAPLRATE